MKYVVYLTDNFKYTFESSKDDLTTEEIAYDMGVHPDEIAQIIIEEDCEV